MARKRGSRQTRKPGRVAVRREEPEEPSIFWPTKRPSRLRMLVMYLCVGAVLVFSVAAATAREGSVFDLESGALKWYGSGFLFIFGSLQIAFRREVSESSRRLLPPLFYGLFGALALLIGTAMLAMEVARHIFH